MCIYISTCSYLYVFQLHLACTNRLFFCQAGYPLLLPKEEDDVSVFFSPSLFLHPHTHRHIHTCTYTNTHTHAYPHVQRRVNKISAFCHVGLRDHVLQCVAVCCSALQRVAVCQFIKKSMRCSVLQCVAVRRRVGWCDVQNGFTTDRNVGNGTNARFA